MTGKRRLNKNRKHSESGLNYYSQHGGNLWSDLYSTLQQRLRCLRCILGLDVQQACRAAGTSRDPRVAPGSGAMHLLDPCRTRKRQCVAGQESSHTTDRLAPSMDLVYPWSPCTGLLEDFLQTDQMAGGREPRKHAGPRPTM